jgi:hypothetical protein
MFLLETAVLLEHQIPHGHLHGSSLLLFLIADIVLKDKTDIVTVICIPSYRVKKESGILCCRLPFYIQT